MTNFGRLKKIGPLRTTFLSKNYHQSVILSHEHGALLRQGHHLQDRVLERSDVDDRLLELGHVLLEERPREEAHADAREDPAGASRALVRAGLADPARLERARALPRVVLVLPVETSG